MTEAVVDLSALGPVTLMPEVCDAMGEALSEEGADREGSLSIDAVAKVNNDSRILRTYGAALVEQGRSEEACRYSRTEAQKSSPAESFHNHRYGSIDLDSKGLYREAM